MEKYDASLWNKTVDVNDMHFVVVVLVIFYKSKLV